MSTPLFSSAAASACTAAILAGGKSSRMGNRKEDLLLPNGKTMVEHLEAVLATVCGTVVVVGKNELPDLQPGLGPLGGLETLLASKRDRGYLVTACDQPLLTASLVSRLLEGDASRVHLFRAPDEDAFFPFPGYYPPNLLPLVSELLSSEKRSMRAFISHIEPVWIPISETEERQIVSINTPEQYSALKGAFDAAS